MAGAQAQEKASRHQGKKTLSKNRESRKAIAQALRNLGEQNLALVQKVQILERKLDVLYQNQRELVQSENRLDEQFCVSTRLAIMWLNSIIKGARMTDEPWALELDSVTYDKVNELFKDFAEFRGRPDFRNHMRAWFMGEPIDSLPEVKGDEDARSDDGDTPAAKEGPEGGEHGQEDPVPVRGQDATETESPRP